MSFRLRGAPAPPLVPVDTVRATSAPSKRALALCFAPLLLLGAASVCSAIARQGTPKKQLTLHTSVPANALDRTPMGTRTCRAANAFLERVLGSQATVAKATILGGRSVRSTAAAAAWSVLCDTSDGNYLLLISAKTRQVYAVNHVEDTKFNLDYHPDNENDNLEDSEAADARAFLSRDAAKGEALHYLSLLGISSQNLKAAPDVYGALKPRQKNTATRVYNFAFTDARNPAQSIVVVVNSRNGHLQSLWRPVQAI